MKPTDSKVIIYDDNCPLCTAYTSGFIKAGLLKPGNRMSFSELQDRGIIQKLYLQRSRHEIPLVDMQGGETLYGVDSLTYILKQNMSFIGNLMRQPAARWFFKKLYKLVSYNRRVVAPPKESRSGINVCPDFNTKYRLLFIILAVLIASFVTYWFGAVTQKYLQVDLQVDGGFRMLLIAGTGWVMQMLFATLFLQSRKAIEYIGHLGVIMVVGVLILIPSIPFGAITSYSFPLIPAWSVFCSSATMLWMHYRRVRHLQLSQWWTVVWFLSLQATATAWVYFFYFQKAIL
jgi:predicted DCC family thiol-disulfide oxidoreductase YuxK